MKAFHLGCTTNVITALGTNAPMFAFRYPSGVSRRIYLQRVACQVMSQTNPATARREFGIEMRMVDGMTANPTGGVDISDPTTSNYAIYAVSHDVQRIRDADRQPTSILAASNVRVSSTAALAFAPGTARTMPFIGRSTNAPVATAEAQGAIECNVSFEWKPVLAQMSHLDPLEGCLPLFGDTGFIISAPVGLADSLAVRGHIEVDWLEE